MPTVSSESENDKRRSAGKIGCESIDHGIICKWRKRVMQQKKRGSCHGSRREAPDHTSLYWLVDQPRLLLLRRRRRWPRRPITSLRNQSALGVTVESHWSPYCSSCSSSVIRGLAPHYLMLMVSSSNWLRGSYCCCRVRGFSSQTVS